jgi:hypothetical protein
MLNSGSILASTAAQVAVQAAADSSGIDFTNAAGGVVCAVRSNWRAGENHVNLEHGSQATDVYTLEGNDRYRLKNID